MLFRSNINTRRGHLGEQPEGVVYLPAVSHEAAADERLRRIDALDLEPVIFKLTHPEPGETGLTLAHADADVALYRCFLKLCLLYPDVAMVPTRRIDHVWHTHVLDTSKYRADCDHIFGRFLDHFPYAGLRDEDDRRVWQDAFARTRHLFSDHFGVEIGALAASICHIHSDGSDCCAEPGVSATRPRPQRASAAD